MNELLGFCNWAIVALLPALFSFNNCAIDFDTWALESAFLTRPFLSSVKVTQELEFIGSDFEFFTISLLVMLNIKILENNYFDWTIMGETTIVPRSLKTKRNKQIF